LGIYLLLHIYIISKQLISISVSTFHRKLFLLQLRQFPFTFRFSRPLYTRCIDVSITRRSHRAINFLSDWWYFETVAYLSPCCISHSLLRHLRRCIQKQSRCELDNVDSGFIHRSVYFWFHPAPTPYPAYHPSSPPVSSYVCGHHLLLHWRIVSYIQGVLQLPHYIFKNVFMK